MKSALSQFKSAIENNKQDNSIDTSKLTFEVLSKSLACTIESEECACVEDRAHLIKLIVVESKKLHLKLGLAGIEISETQVVDLICDIGTKTGAYDSDLISKIYPIEECLVGFNNDQNVSTTRYSFSKQFQLKTITRIIPIISKSFSDYSNERNLFLSVLDAIEQAISYLIKSCNLNCDLSEEGDIYLDACANLYIATLKSYLIGNNKQHLLQDDFKQIRIMYGKNIGLLILTIQSAKFIKDSK